MKNQPPSEPRPDVLGPAQKLANIIKEDPSMIDRESYKRGDKLLVIFADPNFGNSIKGMSRYKTEVIMEAIEDLAGRGKLLAEGTLCVLFSANKLKTSLVKFGESPDGNVVFKVGVRDTIAFQRWRNGAINEINQDDINAGIYRLTAAWAELL
jgi:hypothetical protein